MTLHLPFPFLDVVGFWILQPPYLDIWIFSLLHLDIDSRFRYFDIVTIYNLHHLHIWIFSLLHLDIWIFWHCHLQLTMKNNLSNPVKHLCWSSPPDHTLYIIHYTSYIIHCVVLQDSYMKQNITLDITYYITRHITTL